MNIADTSSFTKNDYEIIEYKIMYEGVFRMAQFHLRHKLFNGEWGGVISREIMERPPAAGVLPYDPLTDHIVLIEQFRAGALANPIHPWLIEIVAGLVDKDEKPEEVAIRETREEAGCTITQLEKICHYFVSPGGCNEEITLFIGKVDATHLPGIYGLAEENEDIRAFTVPFKEAMQMVARGKINTSPALVSLLWLQLNKERLLTSWQIK